MKKYLLSAVFVIASIFLLTGSVSSSSVGIPDTGFEDGTLTSWNIGSQTGSLSNNTITQNGTGVTVFSGGVTFSAGSHPGAGSPSTSAGLPNPYYQPPVAPATWSFSAFGSKAVALQPAGQYMFNSAASELGLSNSDVLELKAELSSQATASGYGSGNPTDAAWISKSVTLSAGVTYAMSWNYIGTDYVPFNDGSITSLTTTSATANAIVTVNNKVGSYALLGFTNPGTGDYSTGTFGSTGWQVSTYQVSEDGEYLLGFAVFNLDDQGLSPVLLVDSQPGSTLKNGESFGAVAPNNPNAPTVAPTVPPTEPPTTEPIATEPPESSTTTEAPTSESPQLPPVIYVPPFVDATTSVPVEAFPDTAPPTDAPVPQPDTSPTFELPKTGSGSIANIGLAAFFVLMGALIVFLGKELKND